MNRLVQAAEVPTNEEEIEQLLDKPGRDIEFVQSDGKTYTFIFEYGEGSIIDFFKKMMNK